MQNNKQTKSHNNSQGITSQKRSDTPPSSLPRLGPTWKSVSYGGRGFQPPPAVPTDNNSSRSIVVNGLIDWDKHCSDPSHENETRKDMKGTSFRGHSHELVNHSSSKILKGGAVGGKAEDTSPFTKRISYGCRPLSSRCEALKSPGISGYGRTLSLGIGSPGMKSGTGRTLAELASRVSLPVSTRAHPSRNGFEELACSPFFRSSGIRGENNIPGEKNVIRFTREKILSMRTRPNHGSDILTPLLKHMEGSPLLSIERLDPVCWDTLDADEIWAQTARDRPQRNVPNNGASKGISSGSILRPLSDNTDKSRRDPDGDDRRGYLSGGIGRWQRGVALPPPESLRGNCRQNGQCNNNVENCADLWDDPLTSEIVTSAAKDFSAFGGSLNEKPKLMYSNRSNGDIFDLGIISEASRKFEEELHGSKIKTSIISACKDNSVIRVLDPRQPLVCDGSTIKSGSGDTVNVFEDFSVPEKLTDEKNFSYDDENHKSSQMLTSCLASDESTLEGGPSFPTCCVPVGGYNEKQAPEERTPVPVAASSIFAPFSSSVPRNPWGSQILPSSCNTNQEAEILGFTRYPLKSKPHFVGGQVKNEENKYLHSNEGKKPTTGTTGQAISPQATSHCQQTAMQAHSHVELILIERISSILENSWGRLDALSLLSALHSEDLRFISLLRSMDDLRSLISRFPRRIALVKDPTFGAEVAVLIMTNIQCQPHDVNEMQLGNNLQQYNQIQTTSGVPKEHSGYRTNENTTRLLAENNASWYYSDPQCNVQGPFRGEEMRQWLEAGYFKGDLPISQSVNGPFKKLSSLFSDINLAFVTTEQFIKKKEENIKASKELSRTQSEPFTSVQLVTSQDKIDSKDPKLASNKESDINCKNRFFISTKKKGQDKLVGSISVTNKNQSEQLKMLLGLNAPISNLNTNDIILSHQDKPNKISNETNATSVRHHIVETSFNRDMTKSHSGKITHPKAVITQPHKVSMTTPAWGGAGSGKIIGRKMRMSEIQQEEATANVTKQRESIHCSSSGGWANVAASGGASAWSEGTVIPTANTSSSLPSSAINTGTGTEQARLRHKVSENISSSQVLTVKESSKTQKTMEEFGANKTMSPDLENWCKNEMRKLTGSEDLTLVAFCMTLSDLVEIRQYLTTYLGTSSQVNNFASEFIYKVKGDTKHFEQWETTVSSKKGRKKKQV